MATRLIDPSSIRVNAVDGQLWLQIDGDREPIGEVTKCFPQTSPRRWISFRRPSGEEAGLIREINTLDTESKAILERVLHNRYHIPKIRTVLEIIRNEDGAKWRVDTDDGELVFTVGADIDVDINSFPTIVLTDRSDQRRYQIDDYTELDRPSQIMARRHLPISRGRGGGSHRRFR